MSVDHVIRQKGYFLRRRDLLALGYTDAHLRSALAAHRIFRVRHGWYSVPDAPEAGVRAVRVGGRLTSLSALETFGLPVPRRRRFDVAVGPTASRLRDPADRRARLRQDADVAVHWVDDGSGGLSWRVSLADALLAVLVTQSRDIALACCGAALQNRLLTLHELDEVFARAPLRVQAWRALVSGLDEAHGETFFRVWIRDAGLPCAQQVRVPGVGRFDFQVGPHTYVEIDGAQHDPTWSGDSPSSWEGDLDRAAAMAIRGDRVLHFGYRQLYDDWPTVLAAVVRAIADDEQLTARRRSHPYRPRAPQKRRRFALERPSW
jgi:hypothetical protein